MKRGKAVRSMINAALCMLLLSGCTAGEEKQNPNDSSQQSTAGKEEKTVLPSVLPLTFVFSSGAGGWGNLMTLYADGSFEGTYNDSEMREEGEGYPNGSVYTCTFRGKFHQIRKIDNYTYAMVLQEITVENAKGEEWIKDQIRYVAAEPYGLEKGKKFLLYMPETPIQNLSEEFLSWWPQRFLPENEVPDTLSCYGLYNQEAGYGFFSG